MRKQSLEEYSKNFYAPVRENQQQRVLKRMSELSGLSEDVCREIRDNFLESWFLFLSNPQLINVNGIRFHGLFIMKPVAKKIKKSLISLGKPRNAAKRRRWGDSFLVYFNQLKQFYVQAKSKRRVYDYGGNGTVDPKKSERVIVERGTATRRIRKFNGIR
jgi:hypothetical protein